MECKHCGSQMYERKSKQASNSTRVYICPKCNAVIYVWPDGDVKEEKKKISIDRKISWKAV